MADPNPIAVSQSEREWLNWLNRARDQAITLTHAAEKMGVTERWVRTLLAEMPAGQTANTLQA